MRPPINKKAGYSAGTNCFTIKQLSNYHNVTKLLSYSSNVIITM